MPYRVTFSYAMTGSRTAGWTENFWNNATSLGEAETRAGKLKDALLEVHGRQTVLIHTRISRISTPREVLGIDHGSGAVNPSQEEAAVSDYPTTAYVLELRTANFLTARVWLKGCVDFVTASGGLFRPQDQESRLKRLYSLLKGTNAGWCLRGLNRETPKRLVTSMTSLGLATVPAHGYIADGRVRLRFPAESMRYGRGVWAFRVLDNDTLAISKWNPPQNAAAFPWANPGTAQQQVFLPLESITFAEVQRISKHNVGRPFGSPIGRRKIRR